MCSIAACGRACRLAKLTVFTYSEYIGEILLLEDLHYISHWNKLILISIKVYSVFLNIMFIISLVLSGVSTRIETFDAMYATDVPEEMDVIMSSYVNVFSQIECARR